jgi:hypothetical protein
MIMQEERRSEMRQPYHWLTVQEFARMMGRSPRMVQRWIDDGTLAEFGFPVYRVNRGYHNRRTFIRTIL